MPSVTFKEITQIDAYWRAANYLSVGQIYLRDNALLNRPLTRDDPVVYRTEPHRINL
jgi:xylulose-5-phosphate/fructose-6-phosphate phosphoketolase